MRRGVGIGKRRGMMEGSGVEGEAWGGGAAEGEGEREVKEQEGFVREESWGKGRREGEHMRQREDRGVRKEKG